MFPIGTGIALGEMGDSLGVGRAAPSIGEAVAREKAMAVSRRRLLSPEDQMSLKQLSLDGLSLNSEPIQKRGEKRQAPEEELCRLFKVTCMMPPSLNPESSEADLIAYLEYWVAQGDGIEKRKSAQNRFVDAFRWLSAGADSVRLDLSNLSLSGLPVDVFNLSLFKKLHTLLLSGNRLSSIPHEISNLKELYALYLGDNHLTELPDWIGQFPKLTILFVPRNKISEYPSAIHNLKELSIFDINGNPCAPYRFSVIFKS